VVTYLQKHERLSAEERKRQLIEVSIDLFSKKGFGGTTTKEIAAAADVNEAIIFRHFATKQQLYAAILDYKINEPAIKEGVAALCTLMEGEDDEAVFGWLVRKVFEVYREDQRFERLMLFAALEGHEIAVMHHNIVSPFVDALRKYVERRQREGALTKCDPFVAISAIVGAAKQFAMAKYLFPWNRTRESDEVVAATLTRIALDGLRADSVKPAKAEKRKKK
jgi:TetR/AcrR family transcriptional regulator